MRKTANMGAHTHRRRSCLYCGTLALYAARGTRCATGSLSFSAAHAAGLDPAMVAAVICRAAFAPVSYRPRGRSD